ncbi:MAG: ion transporter [Hyphomicrobiales bacterium]|nr:MAG: ion transporter [Hyphomicrobiales bacterium]
MADSENNEDGDSVGGLRGALRALYYGSDTKARVFRFLLLGFDLVTVAFFIVSSMMEPNASIHVVDLPIAGILMIDFVARAIVANRPLRFFFRFSSLVDLVVIFSLIAPLLLDNLAFLRVVRMLRLMRSYHVLHELRKISAFFRRNEEIIQSSINLFVFVFVTTAIVYVVEARRNPDINNYFDALYFTVATLTTTGFGDITMEDTLGRTVAVVIMVFGVALFLRLVQTIFRPHKVNYACPQCGLNRHDPDSVHCKHCGTVLNIPTEGEW